MCYTIRFLATVRPQHRKYVGEWVQGVPKCGIYEDFVCPPNPPPGLLMQGTLDAPPPPPKSHAPMTGAAPPDTIRTESPTLPPLCLGNPELVGRRGGSGMQREGSRVSVTDLSSRATPLSLPRRPLFTQVVKKAVAEAHQFAVRLAERQQREREEREEADRQRRAEQERIDAEERAHLAQAR